jgi:uracil-DNA glycosylase
MPASIDPHYGVAASDRIEDRSWDDILEEEREQPYFQSLLEFVASKRRAGVVVFPPEHEVFNAFALTPFERVKVVILGQDPYHGPNQAHGLCFSVKPPVPPPPSLINIFAELHRDLGLWSERPNHRPEHGSLEGWARQGVLLLNAVLTVEAGKAGSHAGVGWERFTDLVIQRLSSLKSGLVFMLWGAYAQRKGVVIDRARHLVLEAPHPSPLSAYRGFIGCGHFSAANRYLVEHGRSAIDWGAAE